MNRVGKICVNSGIVLVTLFGVLFAQNEVAFGNSLGANVATAFKYIKLAIQIGLFIWFVIAVIQGIMGRDKETNWWKVIGIIAAIAFLEVSIAIYNAIAGTGSYIK